MRHLLCAIFLMAGSLNIQAQDIIYKKDNTKIQCKVVEVGPLFLKYTLSEGSQQIISIAKSEVLLIQYASGYHETFDNFSLQTLEVPGGDNRIRNSLSFNFLDIIFLRMQISYEHINEEGNIGYRIPLTLGLYQDEITYFSGFDLNFYPNGQKKVCYFLGPKIRGGYIHDYVFNRENFVALMFNNGVRVTVTPSFLLSVNASVGAAHTYGYGNTVPMASLALLLGFKL